MWWVLLAIAVVLIFGVAAYNGLVQLRIRSEGAWSDIQVQLKRRYELIPNLVETVKGYAAHEQRLFVQVTEARSRAMHVAAPGEKGPAERELTGVLKNLFAVAEQYPQLRANENFLGLQRSLTEIEEALQSARRYYNAVVRDYNTKQAVFPDRLVARLGGFAPKEFFQLDAAEEVKAPGVRFS